MYYRTYHSFVCPFCVTQFPRFLVLFLVYGLHLLDRIDVTLVLWLHQIRFRGPSVHITEDLIYGFDFMLFYFLKVVFTRMKLTSSRPMN